MSQNIGTLVTAAIRPNSPLDPIASAFATEIRGGLHTATSSTDRDNIIVERREWGMMCYVINDDTTYQLTFGYADNTITNNLNWKVFTSGSGGGGTSSEWKKSVLSILTTQPLSPSGGDRYLVGTSSITPTGGSWSVYVGGFIAEFDGNISQWSYTFPTDGMSVRVDNLDGQIFKYEGNYPTGVWQPEKLNQVKNLLATSINGIDYVGTCNPPIIGYDKDVVFTIDFATASVGSSASLNLNGLGSTPIKKIGTLGLLDIDANDIRTGISYIVNYNGSSFQINIPSSTSTIGPPEDGDYTDGLFTDFTPSTPIGTPIDRFNEILKFLVPPPAPVLSDWSGSKSGTLANGKLSFDSFSPIAGATYTGADIAPTNPIGVDGLWSTSGKRLAISPFNGGNLTGVLNSQVAVHTGVPTPAYPAQSFSDADKGYLYMTVNGTDLTSATVDLSNLSSTSSGTSSGFNLSAATSSKFPGGDPFDNFSNRTGTWTLRSDEPSLVFGYNWVTVKHENLTPPGTFSRTLNRFEFIVDHNTTSTLITNPIITGFLFSGSKFLSGINFYTAGYINYNVTIDNLYRNTYYPASDAITFTDQSGASILDVTAQRPLANSLGNELKQFILSNIDQEGSSMTFSVLSPGRRRIFQNVGVSVNAKRTVQGNTSGGTAVVNNVLLDNVNATSTLTFEGFDDENYRLRSGLSYDTYGAILSNVWNSNQSLIGGTSGWTDGLQVIGGGLIYPVTNFSSVGSISVNPNFGNLLTNYSSASGSRYFLRYFRQVSPTTGNFTMTINGSSGTFVPLTTSLTGNNIHVELKAPGLSSAETGWLDCYNDFATGQWNDGDGARNSTAGAGRFFGVTWGLTIGTKNTANTSGYMLIRITVGSSFTGTITDITFNFG
jgi:hypothetical protein